MAKNSRKSVPPPAPQGAKKFRPNFGRQMLYAGIALASILGGYYLILQFMPTRDIPKKQVSNEQPSSPQPWYKKQSPPPSLITVPDAPLFPEPDEEPLEAQKIDAVRAYEEALPKEIYEPHPPTPAKVEPQKPAPIPEKIEKVITADAGPVMPPWRRNAVALPATGDRPLIAIVIDDMGVDKARSARVIKLQAPLTLSFLTYAENLDRQTSDARASGHELMLHVSMEPLSSAVDAGPNVLLTDMADDEIRRRLDWGFSRFTGYVGVNNHMGSKFTANSHAMEVVIEAVKRRGLLFLDSRTSGRTVAAKLARQMHVPSVERNIFIDNVGTVDEVNARLKEVEKFARRNGFVVAIGHPRQATIEALEIWLAGLQDKGFRLAPISTIVSLFGAS